MKKTKNSWTRFWGWFWTRFWTRFWGWFWGWYKENPLAKSLLLVGSLLFLLAAVLFCLDHFMPEKYNLDYETAGGAGIALLGVGGLLLRAASSDKIAAAQHKTAAAQHETAATQHKAEKNQRLAEAIKLMASMEKNARMGYLPYDKDDSESKKVKDTDDKDPFGCKEVLHPDEMAQIGGIEILYQLMQEDKKYHKLGANLLRDFIFRGANEIDYARKMQGGGYPLHKFLHYYRVGFNIQKALRVLGLVSREGIRFSFSSLYLVGMDSSSVHFSDMSFIGSNMSNCILGDAHFTNCILTWADLTYCYLRGAHFTDCDLSKANFTNSHISLPGFPPAKFKNTDIDACNFTGACIEKETLLEASFKIITAPNGEKMSRERVEQFDKEEWDRIAFANIANLAKLG